MTSIPCNFEIPKNVHRVFSVEYTNPDGFVEFQQIIVIDCGEIKYGHFGSCSGKPCNLFLDWIQGTIETIRRECYQNIL